MPSYLWPAEVTIKPQVLGTSRSHPVGGVSARNEKWDQIHTEKGEGSLSNQLTCPFKLTFARNPFFSHNSYYPFSPFRLFCLSNSWDWPCSMKGKATPQNSPCRAGALGEVRCETVVKRLAGASMWSGSRVPVFRELCLIFTIGRKSSHISYWLKMYLTWLLGSKACLPQQLWKIQRYIAIHQIWQGLLLQQLYYLWNESLS